MSSFYHKNLFLLKAYIDSWQMQQRRRRADKRYIIPFLLVVNQQFQRRNITHRHKIGIPNFIKKITGSSPIIKVCRTNFLRLGISLLRRISSKFQSCFLFSKVGNRLYGYTYALTLKLDCIEMYIKLYANQLMLYKCIMI